MGALGVMHGSHDSHLFAVFREKRQVLTELDSRGCSWNFAELAFVVRLSIRFGIKRFLLGHPSPEKEDDAGFCLGC